MRLILAALLLSSTAMATERPAVCSGTKPGAKVQAVFAVNQKAPKGIPVDRLEATNREYNIASDHLIAEYFKLRLDNKGELTAGRLTYQPFHVRKVSDVPLKYEITRDADNDPKRNPSTEVNETLEKVDGSVTYRFEEQDSKQPDVFGYFQDHYLSSGATDQEFEKNTFIKKRVDGDWIVHEVTLDTEEICKYARPKTDLVSN